MLNSPITIEELKYHGASDLHIAAFTGDKDAVKRLLAEEQDLYTKRTKPPTKSNYDHRRLSGAIAFIMHF